MRLGYYQSTGSDPVTYNVWQFDPTNPEPFLTVRSDGAGKLIAAIPGLATEAYPGDLIWQVVSCNHKYDIGRYYLADKDLLKGQAFTLVSDDEIDSEEQTMYIVCLLTKGELETLHMLRSGTHELKATRIGT